MAIDLQASISDLLQNPWFELSFLLVISLVASFLFTRFKQSKSIGYIVLGVVIGPSVLGVFSPGDLPDTIMLLAQLGSLILLFMIGLDADLKEIYAPRSIMIALGGSILPWVAGFLVADLFGFGSEAIFIGATLVATSVAITASVISELGIIGTQVSYAILGAAVVDDVIGMVVLGISKAFSAGAAPDPVMLLMLIVGAIAFVGLGAWLGSKILARIVFNVQISGYSRKMPYAGFALAFAIMFIFAVVAEVIGISAIVGAFVAGTIFSGSALRDGLRRGTMYLDAIFVPLFFVLLGTVVDLRQMWNLIWFAIVLTVVAVLTKMVGCAIPARLFGLSPADSLAIGVGMSPRLEVALVIAYYGLTQGIIQDDLYSVVVFMGLMTAVFTPWLLRWTLQRGGHRMTPS